MSRQAELEPRWLVGLLVLWAARELHAQNRSQGWYDICPMLRSGIPGRARSFEPTGYSDWEVRHVGDLIPTLSESQMMAVFWYFRVAMRATIEREFPMHHNSRMEALRRALRTIEQKFDASKKQIAELTEP